MACNWSCAFSLSPHKIFSTKVRTFFFCSITRRPVLSPVANGGTPSKNALISEAVRILGHQAMFDASKLTVDFMGQEVDEYTRVMPRMAESTFFHIVISRLI